MTYEIIDHSAISLCGSRFELRVTHANGWTSSYYASHAAAEAAARNRYDYAQPE